MGANPLIACLADGQPSTSAREISSLSASVSADAQRLRAGGRMPPVQDMNPAPTLVVD
jgi:hypothetical protein